MWSCASGSVPRHHVQKAVHPKRKTKAMPMRIPAAYIHDLHKKKQANEQKQYTQVCGDNWRFSLKQDAKGTNTQTGFFLDKIPLATLIHNHALASIAHISKNETTLVCSSWA